MLGVEFVNKALQLHSHDHINGF